MKKYILLFFIFLSLLPIYSQDNDRPYSHRVQQGLSFLEKNDFSTAIQCFNNALRENSKDGDAYYYRGKAYLEMGEYQKALDDFNTFLRADNLNIRFEQILPTWRNRGEAYSQLKDYEAALYNYNHYIITMTDHLNMAEIIGSDAEIIETFNQEIAYCYLLRGRTYNIMGNLKNAMADFTTAINLDVYQKSVYIDRGVGYYYLKEYEKAIQDILKYLDNDPRIIPKLGQYYANYYLGRSYALLENYSEAIKYITSAIAIEKKDAFLYDLRGLCYFAIKEYTKAKNDFLEAYTLDPLNKDYFNHWMLAIDFEK